MANMKLCRLTEEDRFGNYKHRKIGSIGICCKFCGGLPGFGRHFPGSFQSLLSGSHCVRIVKHMRSECRSCPPSIRGLIEDLDSDNGLEESMRSGQSQGLDHGSRKRFVAFVWAKLQEAERQESCVEEVPVAGETHRSSSTGDLSCGDQLVHPEESLSWNDVVDSSALVEARDIHLVPDPTLFALAQMKMWPLTKEDRIGRHSEQPLGFVGMCCKFCGGKTGRPRYGRYFPSSLKTLAKPASCDRIANHIASECPMCPDKIRIVLRKLQHRELSNERRYGSRNIFFQRLWNRLHESDETTRDIGISSCDQTSIVEVELDNVTNVDFPWEKVFDGNSLVSTSDRGLVPDSQLIAVSDKTFLLPPDSKACTPALDGSTRNVSTQT